jgi:hypothetical protein
MEARRIDERVVKALGKRMRQVIVGGHGDTL